MSPFLVQVKPEANIVLVLSLFAAHGKRAQVTVKAHLIGCRFL